MQPKMRPGTTAPNVLLIPSALIVWVEGGHRGGSSGMVWMVGAIGSLEWPAPGAGARFGAVFQRPDSWDTPG
jgi:hypothetical protein